MVKVVSDSVHRQLTDDDTSPARPPAKSLPGGHFFALTPHRTAPEGAASKHHRKSSLLARDRMGPTASPPRATHAAIMQPDQGPRPAPARGDKSRAAASCTSKYPVGSAHRFAAAHAARGCGSESARALAGPWERETRPLFWRKGNGSE